MKTIVLYACLLMINIMWFPSEEGNPTVGYVVEVSDRLGQIIETGTVTTPSYSTNKEGTIYFSVAAFDKEGNIGEFSVWSEAIATPQEELYIREHARLAGIPFLSFLNTYAISLKKVWRDPHEDYE